MIRVDGSAGEGGGQVLRTALCLSAVMGQAVRVDEIRASRDPPGLRAQHLTAVRAVAEITGGELEGDEMGSRSVTLGPGLPRAGRYRFDTGSAGSAVLVLQTVLPPLLASDGESTVEVGGGTHNPAAPPYEFMARAFLPFLNRGARRVDVRCPRHGFFPAGGGLLRATVSPSSPPDPMELTERATVTARRVRAVVSDLPRHIAEREASTVHAFLDLRPDAMEVVEIEDSRGPGNVVMVSVEMDTHAEVFTGFGRKGVPAEEVALEASRQARAYLESSAPVGPHLADQLLLPLALEGGGRFRATAFTEHARTNAEVIRTITGASVETRERDDGTIEVDVTP